MLDGSFERRGTAHEVIPDREELQAVFARLQEGPRPVHFFSDVTMPKLDKIYQVEQIDPNSNKFLTYFLGKLNEAIQVTRDIEVIVEDFIKSSNKYLAGESLSSDLQTTLGRVSMQRSSSSTVETSRPRQ